jgi:HAD superfamily hydrolase (TIGR01509 family)
VTVKDQAEIDEVLARTRHVLLDFDGPICSIFAGLPAPSVAAQLKAILRVAGVGPVTKLAHEDDPIEVFRFSSKLDPKLAVRVESALSAAEVKASRSADPTPYVREFVRACRRAGRSIAVVSNNAQAAVRGYLAAHRLIDDIGPIVGRATADPALLKPSPYLVLRAIDELGADPATCTMIGDSVTDIESARAAGARSIGYANRPGKHEQLAIAGADVVITTLADLLR